MTSHFIMNGVCIKWVGWIDMDTLIGKARLLFDDENAKVSICKYYSLLCDKIFYISFIVRSMFGDFYWSFNVTIYKLSLLSV